MLQQGRVPQLQSACRLTDRANGTGVDIPGEQICGRDFLRFDGGVAGRSASDRRGYQRSRRLPKCARCSRTDGSRIGRRKVAIYRWVSAGYGYAAATRATAHRRIRRWLYPRQGPKVPWRGLVRSHRWQEHARGRRREMLCLRADLRHKAEAAVVRTDEVTRTPGQSAGDLPVRRCGRREGVAAVSEPGVRALARLVSRRDAAQGGGFANVILRMRTGSNAIALQSRSHLEHHAKTRFAAYDKYLLVAGAAAGMATLCFPFIRCLC